MGNPSNGGPSSPRVQNGLQASNSSDGLTKKGKLLRKRGGNRTDSDGEGEEEGNANREIEDRIEELKKEDKDKEEEQKDKTKKLAVRHWRENDEISQILNEPASEPTAADLDLQLVVQRINEWTLRNPRSQGSKAAVADVWWSTESDEVKNFRRLMDLAAEQDEADWKRAHPTRELDDAKAARLLPKYHAAPLGPRQVDELNEPKILVRYKSTQSTETFGKTMSADTALQRVESSFRSQGIPVSCNATQRTVFKVIGKSDFIWGTTRLIDFSHIRTAALSKLEVRLTLQVVDKSMTEEDNIVKYCYRDMLRTRCGLCCVEGETETKDHLALSIESQVAHMNKELSLWDMDVETEITVQSLSSMAFLPEMVQKQKMLKEGEDVYVCVVGQLIHGMRQLACPQKTPWRVVREAVPSKLENIMHTVWGAPHGTLRFGVKLSHIPRDARLCLTAVVCTDVSSQRFEDASKLVDDNAAGFRRGRTHKSKPEDAEELPLFYLGWVNFMLFDYRDVLRSGSFPLRMWVENQNANPVGVVATPKTDSKQDREKQLTVTISLAKFARPIRFPRGIVPSAMRHQLNDAHAQSMNELDPSLRQNVVNQLRRVRSVIEKDPLYHLEPADKLLLWQFRNDLTTNPCALSKFLQAVDWASPAAVQGALHLLHHPDPSRRWRRPAPGNELIALELLDARYANTRVREYAIDILDNLCDSLLAECILQLVQVLKYEPYHYSALARLLLRRALANPHQIGHAVFWHLKAEMSNPLVQERHGLLIEEMLKRSPISIRRNFEKQDALVEILLKIAVEVKETHVKARERNTFMRQNLDKRFAKIIKPGTTFTLPLDPRMECSGVLVDKCKVMDSKKLPLWLVFKNADPVGDPVFVIFKAGDDLRQDLLTLQILSMMDSFWKAQGMDLHMSCYGCVACDDGVGMIEVVLNAETIASITRDQGGAGSAFSEEPMLNWLRKQQCNKSEEGVKKCLTNFMLSCAGYCVATYILGLGDRHNDNIMMKRDGTYFHIDFGHILGNKKSKFGVKRETTPFIFTPMYAFILGGEKSYVYKHFVSVACRSYNIVRRSAHIIITLFTLMLSTGIPELQTPHDIEYLQKVLMINEPEDSKAAKAYEENIRQAVANRRTLMNDFVHITVHYS